MSTSGAPNTYLKWSTLAIDTVGCCQDYLLRNQRSRAVGHYFARMPRHQLMKIVSAISIAHSGIAEEGLHDLCE